MTERNMPPESVALVYKIVGEDKTHVFASRGIKGLVHIGHHDRRQAFDEVILALNQHVSRAYHCEVRYKSELSYEEFSDRVDNPQGLDGNFFLLNLVESRALA